MNEAIDFILQRQTFSQARLADLSGRLAQIRELRSLQDLCVFATGSYARNEASTHSDIDLFFVHRGSESLERVSRLAELRLSARIIDLGEELNSQRFPMTASFSGCCI
jgi:UTP:GlnB (protein PII) uridylyltransferase